MCLCMLRNIVDVGAEGPVQGADVGAVGTVVQKDVGAFGTVEQNDVLAAGTVRKCCICPGKESTSAVSHQSSVISPRLKVSDPVLEAGDGSCAAPPPPGVPRDPRTSIPRVLPFRQARCPIPR